MICLVEDRRGCIVIAYVAPNELEFLCRAIMYYRLASEDRWSSMGLSNWTSKHK